MEKASVKEAINGNDDSKYITPRLLDKKVAHEIQKTMDDIVFKMGRSQINIGKLSDFNQAYMYKSMRLPCPARTIAIITGLHTGAVGASFGLQMTNIYNGLYVNNLDREVSFEWYGNFVLRSSAPDVDSPVYLDVLYLTF